MQGGGRIAALVFRAKGGGEAPNSGICCGSPREEEGTAAGIRAQGGGEGRDVYSLLAVSGLVSHGPD
jgi:hypothetical protein